MDMEHKLREHRRKLLRALIDEYANGEVVDFARMVGVKSPSQIHQYLGDFRALGDAVARRIENRLGLPQGYFDLPRQGGATTTPGVAEAGTSGNVKTLPVHGTRIPLLSDAPAGPWMELVTDSENNNNLTWLPAPPTPCSAHTYALRVVGDSMLSDTPRSYPPGSLIYVDPNAVESCGSGSAVVARLPDGEVIFKLLVVDAGKRFLRSLHRGYPIIEGEFEIIGKVIGTYTPEDL